MSPPKPIKGKLTKGNLAMLIHELIDEPINARINSPTLGYKIVDTIVNTMAEALHRGEEVHIAGFGKFKVVDVPPRRIPHMALSKPPGEDTIKQAYYSPVDIVVPAKKRVAFSAYSQLRAMLNTEHPSWKQRRAMKIW